MGQEFTATTRGDSDDDSDTGGRKSLLNMSVAPQTAGHDAKRQRVLVLSSRGVIHRCRHLMSDLLALMPHAKKEAKLDCKANLDQINELAELENCGSAMYFETRKHKDMFLWLAKTPSGPSVKFALLNVHTMAELRLAGNCLKGSRSILSFSGFGSEPHWHLVKEMLVQAFGVPLKTRRAKPFIDHVITFSLLDAKVWIRTWQIVESPQEGLVEIGPRCVLDTIRLFDGSFGGSTLFQNTNYVTPNAVRRQAKLRAQGKYVARQQGQRDREFKQSKNPMPLDPLERAFDDDQDQEDMSDST